MPSNSPNDSPKPSSTVSDTAVTGMPVLQLRPQGIKLSSLNDQVINDIIDLYDQAAYSRTGVLIQKGVLDSKSIATYFSQSKNDRELRIGSEVNAHSKLWIHLAGSSELEGTGIDQVVYFRFDANTLETDRTRQIYSDFRHSVDRYLVESGLAVPLNKTFY